MTRKGFDIALSTIGKYESGELKPNGVYIHQVSICLELNDQEVDALFKMAAMDFTINLSEEYGNSRQNSENKLKKGQ
jgi:hypothetical protein